MKHYIITNREVIESLSENVHQYRKVNNKEYLRTDGKEYATDCLRYGTYTFDANNEEDKGEVNLFEDYNNEKWGSDKYFEEIHKEMIECENEYKKDILFFIHGFNTDLEDALTNIRTLHNCYVVPKESPIKQIILFTWPAMSSLRRYRNDAKDADDSGSALGRMLEAYHYFFSRNLHKSTRPKKEFQPCSSNIHLLAHSMGNRVLESAFNYLNNHRVPLYAMLEEVILSAADVDYNVLDADQALYQLHKICNRVHFHYHKKDFALKLSDKHYNTFKRLGRVGHLNKPKELAPNIFPLDVSNTKDDIRPSIFENYINHWYYYTSHEVVQDMIEIFKGNQSRFIK